MHAHILSTVLPSTVNESAQHHSTDNFGSTPSTPPRPTPRRRTTTEDNQSETAVLEDRLAGKLLTDIEAAGSIDSSSWKFQDLCNTNPAVYGCPGSDTRCYYQRISTNRVKHLSRVQYSELINYFGILSASHTHHSQPVCLKHHPHRTITTRLTQTTNLT